MLFLISIELLTILTVVVRVQAIAISLSDSDTRQEAYKIPRRVGYPGPLVPGPLLLPTQIQPHSCNISPGCGHYRCW